MNYGQNYELKSQEKISDNISVQVVENSLEILKKNSSLVDEKINEIIKLNSEYSEAKLNQKRTKKVLRKKIAAAVMSISACVTILAGAITLPLVHVSNEPGAYTERKIYTQSEPVQTVVDYNDDYIEDKNYIKVYDSFDETGTRTIKTYDVTDYKFESPSDALAFDTSTLEPIDIVIDEKTEESKPDDLKEYIKEKLKDKAIAKMAAGYYIVLMIPISVLFAFMVAADFESPQWSFIDDPEEQKKKREEYENSFKGIFGHLEIAKDKLKEYKEATSEKEKIEEEIKRNVDIAIKYIEANEVYKERFIELFNKYSYLYSNPSSIYEKFEETSDSIKDDVTLSLIKEIKSSLN